MKQTVTHKRKDRGRSPRKIYHFLITLPVIIAVLFQASCKKNSADQKAPPPQTAIPVMAATAVEKDVPVELRAIGNVEAYTTVSVKSQVGGYLEKINFIEGHDVKEGDLLFIIDPRIYEAELKQAKANLAKDIAQLENARLIFERDKILIKSGNVSQEEYDQASANAAVLANAVEADKALVENAKLQLSYCYIHAPITGRTGSILINKGNLIKANDTTPMVIINQIQPINVNFAVPAQYLNEIKKRMEQDKLSVEAGTLQGAGSVETGALTFIDNAVDSTTGTIRLKGTFDNKDKILWPGDFVNVVLKLSTRPRVVVVPSQAIVTGQNGKFVFVIKKDLTVEMRDITSDYEINGEVVIDKGLSSGEQVVTDGQLRLVTGSRISIKNVSPEGQEQK